jgi:MoaA/NifB/PqqE/SkfB family radical SAM enzyme
VRLPWRLLPALLRVKRAQRRGQPDRPMKLELFLTWECNARCATCRIWRRPAGPCLTPLQWERLVGSLAPDLLWLSVTGGEVSLRPDLPEMLARVVAVAPYLMYLNLSSNGLEGQRLESALEALTSRFPQLRVAVTLSLDGLGATHDRIRGVPGASDRVAESAARLARLARRRPGLGVACQATLSRANLPEWPRLVAAARALSCGLSPVLSPASEGELLTGGALRVDLRRAAAQASPLLAGLARDWPVRHPEDLVTRRYLASLPGFLRSGRAPLPCAAGYASLSITPEGEVRRCDSLDEALGRAQDFDFDLPLLLGSDRARRAFAARPDCRACWTPCQAYPTLMCHPLSMDTPGWLA